MLASHGAEGYIMIMPASGGPSTQLTFEGASFAHSWSPDGDRLAFVEQRKGVWNVFWISRTTKEQKQLTNYTKLNAFVRYSDWLPLGNQIVYEYVETTGNI
jgi:TolB protein